MILGNFAASMLVFFGKEIRIIFDMCIVVDRLQIAVFVEAVKGVVVVLDMVDEEDTVEMVDFVHEGAGEVAFGFDADFATIFEQSLDFDFLRAADETINFGNGETAFLLFDDFAVSLDDFGVNQGGKRVLFFVIEIVADDDDTLVDPHLRGGHGSREFIRMGFFPIKRKANHVTDNFASFVSNLVDFGRFLTKTRVRGGDNRATWYGSI